MFSAENSIPVFTAAGGSSSNTASICWRSIFGEHGSTAKTRRGFCAVRQAMALAPWTPSAAKVFKSAWMPAPPPLSEPAMVSATGKIFCVNHDCANLNAKAQRCKARSLNRFALASLRLGVFAFNIWRMDKDKVAEILVGDRHAAGIEGRKPVQDARLRQCGADDWKA